MGKSKVYHRAIIRYSEALVEEEKSHKALETQLRVRQVEEDFEKLEKKDFLEFMYKFIEGIKILHKDECRNEPLKQYAKSSINKLYESGRIDINYWIMMFDYISREIE